jgi:secreted trypsin-like serine protease
MTTNNRWVQTGIVSHSIGGCDTGRYGIYTNVGNFYSWINDITKFTEEEVPDFLGLP